MDPQQLQVQQEALKQVGSMGGGIAIVYLVILAFAVVVGWKIFAKAGRPGWAAIIPIYNMIVMLEIIGRPVWWLVLLFIPLVNIVISFIVTFDLARSFGKSAGFGVGLIVLGFIFYPILAFGGAKYVGPVAAQAKPGA